jgi:transcription antitermination factor NusG
LLSRVEIPEQPIEVRSRTARDSCPWFALHVRTCYEKTVATLLDGKGYEWFLPLYKSRRRWSDRVKEIELPLFPGYLFCRFDAQKRLPILKTPGVILVVGIGKAPIPIDPAEISAIQALVKSGLPSQPWPFLRVGERVRINYGALCGLEGILLNLKGHHRIVLSVTLLQRSVAVEIDAAWVCPIRHLQNAPSNQGVQSQAHLH